MLCESCKKKEATVHLTQVIGGEVKKVHLCAECAQKSGINLQSPLSITDLLVGMGLSKPAERPEREEAERSCPRCHMRRTDFKKTGRFGCAYCYEAFADELPPLLKAMHRSDHHSGKIPRRERIRVEATSQLADLQRRMEKAIAEENFEEAARLRDAINACRRKLAGSEQATP